MKPLLLRFFPKKKQGQPPRTRGVGAGLAGRGELGMARESALEIVRMLCSEFKSGIVSWPTARLRRFLASKIISTVTPTAKRLSYATDHTRLSLLQPPHQDIRRPIPASKANVVHQILRFLYPNCVMSFLCHRLQLQKSQPPRGSSSQPSARHTCASRRRLHQNNLQTYSQSPTIPPVMKYAFKYQSTPNYPTSLRCVFRRRCRHPPNACRG